MPEPVFVRTPVNEGLKEACRTLKEYMLYVNKMRNYTKGMPRGEAKMLIENVDTAMQNFRISLQEACRGLGHTLEEYEKAEELFCADFCKWRIINLYRAISDKNGFSPECKSIFPNSVFRKSF